MSWQPDPNGLSQIVELLRNGQSPDNAVQRRVQAELYHISQTVPDFPCYLAYSLATPNESSQVRGLAGYALKAHMKSHLDSIQPPVLAYIKLRLLDAISDTDPLINNVTGSIISQMLAAMKIEGWPEALAKLLQMADPQSNLFEAALSTIVKICEDMSDDLVSSPTQPLNAIFPKLVPLIGEQRVRIAVLAIRGISELVHSNSPTVESHFETFLQQIFNRATDTSDELRTQVCNCLVKVLEFRPEKLQPHMDNVIKYMLHCTQNGEPTVALESCEFWLTLADQSSYATVLKPYLSQLVPCLLNSMVYSEDEIIEFGGDQDDAHIPDRQEDIKPRHYHAKSHEVSQQDAKAATHANNNNTAKQDGTDSDYEDYDDDDDGDEEDDFYSQWTLRKCSAAALDVLATMFKDDILTPLLPLLKDRLGSADWLQREVGILALGAIAEGCMDGVIPHLNTLVPFLIGLMNDPKPLVRSISCWTLSRYSEWIVGEGSEFFEPTLVGLSRMVLDRNKRVQEAGCSALATFEEAAGPALTPYIRPILENLKQAFSIYQQRNLVILYDCIGSLAEAVGPELNQPDLVNLVLTPLIAKWNALTDMDRDLFPLFECMAAVSVALGLGFHEYAKPVVDRCVRIITLVIQEQQMYAQDPTRDKPEKDFLIVSLDLLAGVVQGLGGSVESLVAQYMEPIMRALDFGVHDELPEVKQSAFALVGDLVINAFIHMKPYAVQLLQAAIDHIQFFEELPWVRVANNAVWAAGELSLRLGAEAHPFAEQLVERITPIFSDISTTSPTMLLENCAITLGRLGTVACAIVAPRLESFALNWCRYMVQVKDNAEKESAFLGFCQLVQTNPNGIIKDFVPFCEAIVHCHGSQQLEETFRNIFMAFKAMMGAQWDQYLSGPDFPPLVRQALYSRFAV
ncbi:hypothetical protein RI367_001473 [Sorochytrium milnesiophthora]